MSSGDSTILDELLDSLENVSKAGHAIPTIILTLALSTFVVMTNYAFSWLQTIPFTCYQSFAQKNKTPDDQGKKLCILDNKIEGSGNANSGEYVDTGLRRALTRKLMEGWVDSLFVTNSLIGVKFSVAEAYLFSSMVLLVLLMLMWKQLQKECYFCEIIKHESLFTSDKKPFVAAKILGYEGFSDGGKLPKIYILVALLTLFYSFGVTLLAYFSLNAFFRDGSDGLLKEFSDLYGRGYINDYAFFRLFIPLVFTIFSSIVAYKCHILEKRKSEFVCELKLGLPKVALTGFVKTS